ncbi:erythromycin resistance leader peptide [Bacillus paralicheniformis]
MTHSMRLHFPTLNQ